MSDDPKIQNLIDSVGNGPLAWILNSSLFERAFLLGLYEGVNLTSGKEIESNTINKLLLKTLFPREKDDSFHSTEIGKNYLALMVELEKNEQEIDFLSVGTLVDHIRRLEKEWQKSVNYVIQEITSIPTNTSRSSKDFISKGPELSWLLYTTSSILL